MQNVFLITNSVGEVTVSVFIGTKSDLVGFFL